MAQVSATDVSVVAPTENAFGVERHATWLELFFDLVFVVAVSRLAAFLHHDLSLLGFAGYLLLFVPVWWNWVGFAVYADQFDTPERHDLTFKGTMLLAMLLILVQSTTIENANAGGARAFALAQFVVRVLLIALYLRSHRQIPEAREISSRYVAGFSIGAALWLLSAFVPEPICYLIWIVALVVEIATPVVAYLTSRSIPVQISHLPERFGLFTIIVLGETILAVTAAVSSVTWTLLAVFIAVAGFAIAVCLWWVYFDYVDVGVVQRALTGGRVELWRSFVFGYGHLFIFAGIIAAGVGLEFAIGEATHAALSPGVLAALCGGIAAVLFATSATQWLTRRSLHSNIPYVRSGASALIVILGMIGGSLAPALVLGLLLLILAALAAYELSLDRQLKLGAAKPQTQT